MSRSVFFGVTFVVVVCTSAAWAKCRTYKESGIVGFSCYDVGGFSDFSKASLKVNSITVHTSEINNIPGNAFYKFRHVLKYLDIHQAGVQTIDSQAFNGLSKLRNLTLWGNSLTAVYAVWFTNLHELRTLDLSSNDISFIEEQAFQQMPKLENLSIDSNKLVSLNWNVFSYLGNLKRARIGKNPWSWWWRAQIARQLDNQHVDYSSDWDNYDWINHVVWNCLEIHQATEHDDSVLDCATLYLLKEHAKTVADVRNATRNCGSQSRELYNCAVKPSQDSTAVTPRVAVRKILQGFIGTFKSMYYADANLGYRT